METLISSLLATSSHPEVRETIIRRASYFKRIIKTPRDLEIAKSLLESAKSSVLQRALIGALPLLIQEIKDNDDIEFASSFLEKAAG